MFGMLKFQVPEVEVVFSPDFTQSLQIKFDV